MKKRLKTYQNYYSFYLHFRPILSWFFYENQARAGLVSLFKKLKLDYTFSTKK